MTCKTIVDVQDSLGVWPFPCDCGDHRHTLVITIGEGDIYLEMSDVIPTLWQRIRAAFYILRYGEHASGEMVVRNEKVEALVDTLRKAAVTDD